LGARSGELSDKKNQEKKIKKKNQEKIL